MNGFRDMRSPAELLLAPKRPLSRELTGVKARLKLGGDPSPGVITDVSQLAGPIRTKLSAAIKNKAATTLLAASITSVLSSFDEQLRKLITGQLIPPDPLHASSNAISSAANFFTFSTLAPGAIPSASFVATIQQRKQQLQQLSKSFSSSTSQSSFSGVALVENTNPTPYPLAADVDLPDVPRLAQGGKAAQADSILKDKTRFTVQGVTVGAGKPNFWARLLSDAVVAAVPTLNPVVNQIFKDRTKSGTWSEPVTPYAAQFPYNHVQQTESGHVIELDDTPGAERVHIFHRSGSFIEFHPNGDVVLKSMKNGYRITMADEHVKVSGNCHVSIDGHSTVYVKGDADMQVDGNFNAQVKGDYNIYAKNINLRAKQTFKGDGTMIDLRYITLPFSIMPVSYGLAPIGFAPRVNMTAVGTDTGVSADLPGVPSDPDDVPLITSPQVSLPDVNLPPENPLSNWSIYTAATAEALSYRAKLFDTPEEVDDVELYSGHVSLQSGLGDTPAGTRRLGGKLSVGTTTVVTANTRPTVNFLNFDDYKGVYEYANSYPLANTTFTLADMSDLALHPTVVEDVLTTSFSEDVPADITAPGTVTDPTAPPGSDVNPLPPDDPNQQFV